MIKLGVLLWSSSSTLGIYYYCNTTHPPWEVMGRKKGRGGREGGREAGG